MRASDVLVTVATGHLADLGFSSPVVDVSVVPVQPGKNGADNTTLLFASDSSLKTAPASSVASGGELSRLVLAVTLAAGGADAEVVAFDEIDAGIGGTTALAMGKKLAALADTRQVICVTHLPQVAAFGTSHLVVSRTGITASVASVEGEERVTEISRMLAGLSDSDLAQQHAAELLDIAHSHSS
jgi:DNA repair protein RecN (Recombination protein N)